MISEEFNIEDFALDLSNQAKEVFPSEIPDDIKEFIVQIIYDFIKITYKALSSEEQLYNINDSVSICQLIGEWTYHKGIDSYKNKFSKEHIRLILQQVAFDIYKKATKAVSDGKTQDEIIKLAENIVNETYQNCVELLEKGNNSIKSFEEFFKQSHLKNFFAMMLNENINELEAKQKSLTSNIKKLNNPVSQMISKYCHLLLHIIFVLILVFMFIHVDKNIFSKIFHYLLNNKELFVLLTALISEFGILTISPYISMSIYFMLMMILIMNPFINFPPAITFLLFLMAIINGLYGLTFWVNKDIQEQYKLLSEIENKIKLERVKKDIELLKAEMDKLNNW